MAYESSYTGAERDAIIAEDNSHVSSLYVHT